MSYSNLKVREQFFFSLLLYHWFTDLSHLIKKVDIKFHKDFQNQSTVNTIVELCAIRDDVTECGVLSRADACKLIDLISLQ